MNKRETAMSVIADVLLVTITNISQKLISQDRVAAICLLQEPLLVAGGE